MPDLNKNDLPHWADPDDYFPTRDDLAEHDEHEAFDREEYERADVLNAEADAQESSR